MKLFQLNFLEIFLVIVDYEEKRKFIEEVGTRFCNFKGNFFEKNYSSPTAIPDNPSQKSPNFSFKFIEIIRDETFNFLKKCHPQNFLQNFFWYFPMKFGKLFVKQMEIYFHVFYSNWGKTWKTVCALIFQRVLNQQTNKAKKLRKS